MKTLICSLTLSIVVTANLFGQSGKLNKDTSAYFNSPLYVVKLADKVVVTTITSALGLVDPKHIDAMEIYTDAKSTQQYGDKAKHGVIIISLKKEAPIQTLSEVYDKYGIKGKYRHLPLFIDSNLKANDVRSYMSVDKIKSVKIAKEKKTGMKYISIITNYIKFKPDPNTTYIRGNVTGASKP